jgi:hypothetical protein
MNVHQCPATRQGDISNTHPRSPDMLGYTQRRSRITLTTHIYAFRCVLPCDLLHRIYHFPFSGRWRCRQIWWSNCRGFVVDIEFDMPNCTFLKKWRRIVWRGMRLEFKAKLSLALTVGFLWLHWLNKDRYDHVHVHSIFNDTRLRRWCMVH